MKIVITSNVIKPLTLDEVIKEASNIDVQSFWRVVGHPYILVVSYRGTKFMQINPKSHNPIHTASTIGDWANFNYVPFKGEITFSI